MNQKATTSIFLMIIFIGQVFSQRTISENKNLPIKVSSDKNINASITLGGLGYFSDPAENLFDLFNLGNVPDSIYGYDSDTQAGTWLNIRNYYSFENNILVATNYSDIFYTTIDSLFYSEDGKLITAILESEADHEYNEYAVKHEYTYEDDMMDSEIISIDITDDSIHNNWNVKRSISYTYSDSKQIEKLTQRLDGDQFVDFYKTVSVYSMNTGGVVSRHDTNFITFPGEAWYPEDIMYSYFQGDSTCYNIQVLQFGNYYALKPDSFGEPGLYKIIDLEYDSASHLKSELTIFYEGIEPKKSFKNVYEYDIDGKRISKTIYEGIEDPWFLTYQYLYYYSPKFLSIPETENNNFSLFPNPVNDVLNIVGIKNVSKIEIYTYDGKLITSGLFSENIPVEFLPAGAYIIKLFRQNTPINSRMFIKT